MADEIRSLNGYLFKDESARAANELLEARVEALEKTASTGGGSTGGGSIAVDETLTQSGAAADAAATGVRIKLLEMVHGTDVNGISFVSAFDTLDGVELTGVWNKAASRIDF